MEHSDKTTAKVIGALLAGAAIGVAIGLLLAPEKGSDTRKKIKEGAGDLADKIKDLIDSVASKTSEAPSSGENA